MWQASPCTTLPAASCGGKSLVRVLGCTALEIMFSYNNITALQGDVLLVADEFNDGWMRGLRLGDLEVKWSLLLGKCTPDNPFFVADWLLSLHLCCRGQLTRLQAEVGIETLGANECGANQL